MDEDHDPADVSHWSEEFLIDGEDESENQAFSLALVELGLKSADLAPLATHLRNGYPIPPQMGQIIADAIDKRPKALCTIYAARPANRPAEDENKKRNRYLDIGRIVHQKMSASECDKYEHILNNITYNGKKIGKTSAYKAYTYFLSHIEIWKSYRK